MQLIEDGQFITGLVYVFAIESGDVTPELLVGIYDTRKDNIILLEVMTSDFVEFMPNVLLPSTHRYFRVATTDEMCYFSFCHGYWYRDAFMWRVVR